MINNADVRLGRNSSDEIKTHAFFAGVDWTTIRNIPAPFVPALRHATDTSYFPTDVRAASPPWVRVLNVFARRTSRTSRRSRHRQTARPNRRTWPSSVIPSGDACSPLFRLRWLTSSQAVRRLMGTKSGSVGMYQSVGIYIVQLTPFCCPGFACYEPSDAIAT
jgi:hypothetical protein